MKLLSSRHDGGSNLTIGKIVATHALRGGLRVHLYSHSDAAFSPDEPIQIIRPKGQKETFIIRSAHQVKRSLLRLFLVGVETKAQADALVGSSICIDTKNLPETEAGTYYWFDLIGLSVRTLAGEELGQLSSIIETGSNDVYKVKQKGKEILIPALTSVVLDVNIETGVMTVALPKGLA